MNFYEYHKSSRRVFDTEGQNVKDTNASEGPETRRNKPLMRNGKGIVDLARQGI